MVFYVFDKEAEMKRLNAAKKHGMTLLEFPIIRDTSGGWRPYSRICREHDALSRTESIIATHHDGTDIVTGNMTIDVRDYFTEVIDRDWV